MSKQDNGGPAFPFPTLHGNGAPTGMTLRDYFAAKALQGLLSSGRVHIDRTNAVVASAYAYADAMLAERAK